MKTKQSKFCLSNWNKRTPKFWKIIGDTCIYSLPLFQGIVMTSPFNSDTRMWINFILGVFLVSAKMFSKFFAEIETHKSKYNDRKRKK